MQPRSRWDDLDFDLVSALDVLEREESDMTGLPWWLTRTGHPQVAFAIDTVEDAAERAQEEYDQRQSEKGGKRALGVRRFAVPESIDGFPIEGGLAREALIAWAKKQADPDQVSEDQQELADLGIDVNGRGGSYDASLYG